MANRARDTGENPLVQTAILIAGLMSDRTRTRDVLFYIDLVKNVFQAFLHVPDFEIQSVQILRKFKRYQELGWGEIRNDNSAVILNLNPQGIFQIIVSLREIEYILPFNEATFLQWFLDSYRQHILDRVSGALNPAEMQKLERYLEPYSVFRAQVERLRQGAKDMEERISESAKLLAFIQESQKKGMSTEEIVTSLPSEFSYRLSHQKRFQEWLQGLPENIQTYEIEKGIAKRQGDLYRRLQDSISSMTTFYQEAQKATLP